MFMAMRWLSGDHASESTLNPWGGGIGMNLSASTIFRAFPGPEVTQMSSCSMTRRLTPLICDTAYTMALSGAISNAWQSSSIMNFGLSCATSGDGRSKATAIITIEVSTPATRIFFGFDLDVARFLLTPRPS